MKGISFSVPVRPLMVSFISVTVRVNCLQRFNLKSALHSYTSLKIYIFHIISTISPERRFPTARGVSSAKSKIFLGGSKGAPYLFSGEVVISKGS